PLLVGGSEGSLGNEEEEKRACGSTEVPHKITEKIPLETRGKTGTPPFEVWKYTVQIEGRPPLFPWNDPHKWDATRFALNQQGGNPPLTVDPIDGIYYTETTEDGEVYNYNIVKAGAADAPAKENLGYKMLFLDSCKSGPYFYNQFQHGTLFFTTENCHPGNGVATYFESILNGESPNTIRKDLDDDEGKSGVHDYHEFK
ncbi:MAG: hypothetical protein AB1696_23630, partial [Planctomycetota bacterium]